MKEEMKDQMLKKLEKEYKNLKIELGLIDKDGNFVPEEKREGSLLYLYKNHVGSEEELMEKMNKRMEYEETILEKMKKIDMEMKTYLS